jgi:Surface antigen variable number repeat
VYHVGRIEFVGTHHYSDALLRRNFLLDEGQLLDGRLLRKSIDRLNRSKLFETTDESQVVIRPREAEGVADVIVKLTERERGAWRLSGPVGPASFAGPLEASISSRLPPWGSGILELATYTASVSMFAFARPLLPLLGVDPRRSLLPVLALARPFSPGEGWKSGFSVAPQFGWRASALSYSATQIQQRLLPALAGDRGLVPELPVTVEGPSGEGVMLCEPPPPRFARLRYIATIGLRFLGAFAGI